MQTSFVDGVQRFRKINKYTKGTSLFYCVIYAALFNLSITVTQREFRGMAVLTVAFIKNNKNNGAFYDL